MRHRLRNVVWRELPFSARRAIINTVRAVDDFERAVYLFWQNLRYSPAWLFVAVMGSAGIVLTVLLFITLSRELLARAEGRSAAPRIDYAELDPAQPPRWDTRLCLENEGLASIPYDAEFAFRGKLPPLTISRAVPEPERTPEIAIASPVPPVDRPAERPQLAPIVEFLRQPHLAVIRPEILTAFSEMADIADRALNAVPDGWDRGQRRAKTETSIPVPYSGDSELMSAAEDPDDVWADPTAFANRADVALRVQLHAPKTAATGQAGQSHLVIRNDGSDMIRRIQLGETQSLLPLVVDAHPGARLNSGLLEREFRRLRPGRERTLGLNWFARDPGDHRHEAIILAEAVVAATVQVEADAPLEPETTPETAPEEPPVLRPRPRSVIDPVEELPAPRPPAPKSPEPAAEVEIQPVPKEEPQRVVIPPRTRTPHPAIACKVKSTSAVKLNEVVELKLEVTNTGETRLSDVRIWADVPGALKHRHGSQLELAVGELQPGQVHHAVLRVVGQQAGSATATFRVVSAENIKANALGQVAVVAPKPVKAAPVAKPARPKLTTPTCPCECGVSPVVWAGYEF